MPVHQSCNACAAGAASSGGVAPEGGRKRRQEPRNNLRLVLAAGQAAPLGFTRGSTSSDSVTMG